MGSRTMESEDDWGNGGSANSNESTALGGEPRGEHLGRDGDGALGDGGGDDDDDDDDDADNSQDVSSSLSGSTANPKKKRKRTKRKKTAAKVLVQSSPPRVQLDQLFPSGQYPIGEIMEYTTPREHTRRPVEFDRQSSATPLIWDENAMNDYRKAAEVHRQVRKWVQETVRPGQTLTEIATGIEDSVRALVGNQGLERGGHFKSGMAFPAGLSINNCVAHYTPNPGHTEIVLEPKDVMKVDFGVHVNGWIVDSAFTMSFDPVYDNLLAAAQDATDSGIKAAGVDVRICDVSAVIQEALESYEVVIDGTAHPVKPVRGICAHDIVRYNVHGGKMIPFVRNNDQTKMEEGEIFAIETFGTTGRGVLVEGPGVYGYSLDLNTPRNAMFQMATATRLYRTIRSNFGSLVFCRRYLDRLGEQQYLAGLSHLVGKCVLEAHRPLMDIEGSYSAQFEHTIILKESSKEVISRGTDY